MEKTHRALSKFNVNLKCTKDLTLTIKKKNAPKQTSSAVQNFTHTMAFRMECFFLFVCLNEAKRQTFIETWCKLYLSLMYLIDQMPRLINASFTSVTAHWFCCCCCILHYRCCSTYSFLCILINDDMSGFWCFPSKTLRTHNDLYLIFFYHYGTHRLLNHESANSQTIKSKLHFLN